MNTQLPDPYDDDDDDFADEAMREDVYDMSSLFSDLSSLVQAGLLVEVYERDKPSRYALTNRGHALADEAARNKAVADADRFPDARDLGAEPCPNCSSPAGYDAGARCRSCHVAFLPEGVQVLNVACLVAVLAEPSAAAS